MTDRVSTRDRALAKIDDAMARGEDPDAADLTPGEAVALLDDLVASRAISRLRADAYRRRIQKWRRRAARLGIAV